MTTSIVAAAVLAAVAIAPAADATTTTTSSSSPDRQVSNATSQDSAYSTAFLPKLKAIESSVAASKLCALPVSSLSGVIASLSSLPIVSKTTISTTATNTCADVNAVANPNLTASALTSMWAWGNPVSASDDARGLGESAFAPATIAAYSSAKKLTNVRLSVPWAADQGSAIGAWLNTSVADLHAKGETVSALGGDSAWVTNPSLVSQWITSAHNAAAFDGVQLDVEPWTNDTGWTTNTVEIAQYVAMVRQAEATAHSLGMTLDIDTPWWLSTTSYGTGTVLSAILPFVDGISIVAFSDHAGGTDGIIEQAWPAVIQAGSSLTPFTIGVQTSSDAVAGGSAYTFADKGSAALESESNRVRAAYSASIGYSGITVEEYLSWLSLGA